MDRASKARALCWIVIAGLTVAVLFHHVFVRHVLQLGFPADSFLYDPSQQFSDFYYIFQPVQDGSPLSGRFSFYFPAAYLPLYPLAGLSWPAAYAVVLAVFTSSVWWFFWRRLDFLPAGERVVTAFVIPMLSFPTVTAIDRGNIELLLVVFVLAFFGLWSRGRSGPAAGALGLAIAAKVYPGVLGVILLVRRQYFAAFLTAVVTLVLTLGAAALYPGGVSGTVELMSQRLETFDQDYVSNPKTHQGSLNYLALVKLFMRVAGIDFAKNVDLIMLLYNAASLALFAAVALYVWKRERVLWKQVYLLVFLALVLPQISFAYKAMHLLLPVALFLAAVPVRRREDLFHLLMFGVLLIPKNWVPMESDTRIAVLIDAPVLTLMAAHIIWTGLRRSHSERLDAQP